MKFLKFLIKCLVILEGFNYNSFYTHTNWFSMRYIFNWHIFIFVTWSVYQISHGSIVLPNLKDQKRHPLESGKFSLFSVMATFGAVNGSNDFHLEPRHSSYLYARLLSLDLHMLLQPFQPWKWFFESYIPKAKDKDTGWKAPPSYIENRALQSWQSSVKHDVFMLPRQHLFIYTMVKVDGASKLKILRTTKSTSMCWPCQYQGRVGYIPTNVPYGKSLYKPYIVGIYGL